jgi:predicted DNA binding protein
MTIIAEFRLSDAPLVLMPSVRAAPGMTLRREWSFTQQDADPVMFVWASGGEFEAFEAALPEDPTIREHERLDDEGDKRLYRVVIDRSVATNPAPIDRATGASRLSIETTAEGAVLEVRLPDREVLQKYVRLLRDEGFTVELLRAHPASQPEDGLGLSSKQAEALQAAHANGYFEVPRETDLETLADELDLSEQALSERIRRGLSAVLDETIGDDAETNDPNASGSG